jgi:hypothetical protein
MKVILHIGMSKSGSSALQAGLHAMHDELLNAGILYPDSGRGWHGHVFLVHGSVAPQRLPRQLLQAYNGDEHAIGRDQGAWMSALEQEVAEARPHTIILSEESLFKIADDRGLASLDERLRRLGDHIDVAAYVRRPSDHYLSAVQQTLKASHRIARPGPVVYRATLEGYARHVADCLKVVKYDPAAWQGRDILRHFLNSFVPTAHAVTTAPPQQVNSSFSAEAMAVLAEYRRRIWPDNNNLFTPDTDQLVRALIAADIEVDGKRSPRLHDQIRLAIDHASIDLTWLRDEHGIVFDGINYDAIHPAPRRPATPQTIEDICVVDADRQAELMYRLLHRLTQAPPRPDSGSATPSPGASTGSITAPRRSPPGHQSRLLTGAIADAMHRGTRPGGRSRRG